MKEYNICEKFDKDYTEAKKKVNKYIWKYMRKYKKDKGYIEGSYYIRRVYLDAKHTTSKSRTITKNKEMDS